MRSRLDLSHRGGQGEEAGAGAKAGVGARVGEGAVTGGGGSLDRETEASVIFVFYI